MIGNDVVEQNIVNGEKGDKNLTSVQVREDYDEYVGGQDDREDKECRLIGKLSRFKMVCSFKTVCPFKIVCSFKIVCNFFLINALCIKP